VNATGGIQPGARTVPVRNSYETGMRLKIFRVPLLSKPLRAGTARAPLGILIACVGLLIFELKKIPVTDYLPSLIYAPLLTWLLMR
jgi:hypothetical protein